MILATPNINQLMCFRFSILNLPSLRLVVLKICHICMEVAPCERTQCKFMYFMYWSHEHNLNQPLKHGSKVLVETFSSICHIEVRRQQYGLQVCTLMAQIIRLSNQNLSQQLHETVDLTTRDQSAASNASCTEVQIYMKISHYNTDVLLNNE